VIHRNDHATQLEWQAQYQLLLSLDFIAMRIAHDAIVRRYQGCHSIETQGGMTLCHVLPDQHHRAVISASKQIVARAEREAAAHLGAEQHPELYHAFLFYLAIEREVCIT
jgi:hypothetical protein